MIRLATFLWLWFLCICPLIPSHNTYHLTWDSLTLDVGISSRLLQQSTSSAPYLGGGVSSHSHPSWPWTWSISSLLFSALLSLAAAAPWRWGSSSCQYLLDHQKRKSIPEKTSISALLTTPKPSTMWITINCGKFWRRGEYQTTWPASWEICMQVRKQQLELVREQQTGSN